MNLKTCLLSGIALLLSTQCQALANAPLALVYEGPGSCPGSGTDSCTGAAEAAAQWSGFQVKRVGPSALTAITTEADYLKIFGQASVWIQPGGGSRTFLTTATPELLSAIRRFVFEGGGYVGFCAGAFSSTATDGALPLKGLGILPGKTYPFINETIDLLFDHVISHFNSDALNNHIYEVNWAGKKRHVYFEEGPQLRFTAEELKKVEVMATYPNGVPVSARTHYGKGRVYVTGMHPEAPISWKKNPDLSDPDGQDYDLVQEMLKWATGDVTDEIPLTVQSQGEFPSSHSSKYLGLSARFTTVKTTVKATVKKSRANSLDEIVGTTEVTITAYNSSIDSYRIKILNTDAVTGGVDTHVAELATQELDSQFTDSILLNCTFNYGHLQNAGDCVLPSSNSELYVGTGLFSLKKSISVDSSGNIFTTSLDTQSRLDQK